MESQIWPSHIGSLVVETIIVVIDSPWIFGGPPRAGSFSCTLNVALSDPSIPMDLKGGGTLTCLNLPYLGDKRVCSPMKKYGCEAHFCFIGISRCLAHMVTCHRLGTISELNGLKRVVIFGQ